MVLGAPLRFASNPVVPLGTTPRGAAPGSLALGPPAAVWPPWAATLCIPSANSA